MKKAVFIILTVLFVIGVGLACFVNFNRSAAIPVLQATEPNETTQAWRTEESEYLNNPYTPEIEKLLAGCENPSLIRPISDSRSFYYYPNFDALPHYSFKACTRPDVSIGFPFVCISQSLKANPIANFHRLVENGLFVRSENENENKFRFTTNGENTPYQMHSRVLPVQAEPYVFNEEGCAQFLQDLHTLVYANSASCELLSERNNFDMIPESIYWSAADDCWYVYTLFYEQSYAGILCIYLRSSDERTITDAELQLLNITYPYGDCAAGISMSTGFFREAVCFEFLSAVTAAELLLTGTCYCNDADYPQIFSDYEVVFPEAYKLGNYSSQMHTSYYYGAEEKAAGYGTDQATLFTYRIKK